MSRVRAGCSRIGLPAAAMTSKIGRNFGSSSGTPLALVASCTALAPFFKARSASLAAASGAFIGNSADQPTKCFGCFAATSARPSLAIFAISGDCSGPHNRSIGGKPWDSTCE